MQIRSPDCVQIEAYRRALEDRNTRISDLNIKLAQLREALEKERRDHARLNSEVIQQNVKV